MVCSDSMRMGVLAAILAACGGEVSSVETPCIDGRRISCSCGADKGYAQCTSGGVYSACQCAADASVEAAPDPTVDAAVDAPPPLPPLRHREPDGVPRESQREHPLRRRRNGRWRLSVQRRFSEPRARQGHEGLDRRPRLHPSRAHRGLLHRAERLQVRWDEGVSLLAPQPRRRAPGGYRVRGCRGELGFEVTQPHPRGLRHLPTRLLSDRTLHLSRARLRGGPNVAAKRPSRFTVAFERRCGPFKPALRGCVHYDKANP